MAEPGKMQRTKLPGVYRRGDRYAVTWRDASGKQRWGSSRTFDEARALKAEKERAARLGERHVPTSEQPTLADYARELFGCDPSRPPGAPPEKGRYAGRHGAVRDATGADYRRDMEVYWLPLLGRKRMPAISAPDVARALAKLAARDGDEYLADRSLKRLFAPFSALMATAVEEGVIPHNPARDVSVPSGRDRLRRFEADNQDDDELAVRPYTRAQIAQLLAVLVGQPQLRLLVHLLAVTGLRISEAIALRWRDVQTDGSSPQVKVRRAWVREQFGPPKSRHGRRKVPIPHSLVVALRQHRQHTDPRVELVFPTSVGTVHRPENLRRTLMPAAQEAGVEWLGFHAFRHGFASALLEDGRNVVQISRLLGHHSPSFTLATYAHLMDDGVGGPLELDLTPSREALDAAVEHVLRQEEV
jgi:integrase